MISLSGKRRPPCALVGRDYTPSGQSISHLPCDVQVKSLGQREFQEEFKKNFPNFPGGVVKFPPADCQVMGNSGHHVANLPGKSGEKKGREADKGEKGNLDLRF